MRMTVAAILLTCLTLGTNPDAEAAYADLATLPAASQPYAHYLTLSDQRSPEAKERLAKTLAFVLPSLSSKSYLGDQLPVRVSADLLRIDTRGLGWEKSLPVVLTNFYPYRPDLKAIGRYPRVFSGTWAAAELVDPTRTKDAQYLLLYGKTITTEAEFKSHWLVQGNKDLFYGRIESKSGVANELVRLIENQPAANRTSHWQTYDSRLIAGQTDPLETLGGKLKYDASELIAAIPKHYAGKSGALQAYFLSDAKGKRQDKAPTDIVTDHTGLRGPEIINTFGCISCHAPAAGLIDPTLDAYREYILGGAKVFADYDTKRRIEQYLQSDIGKEMARGREDYAEAIRLCNGLTPEKNAANWVAVVKAYDAPVDLSQAAREVYSTPDELRNAIASYAPSGKLSARLAALAHGQPMSRDQWIQSQHDLQLAILPAWRRK